MQLVRAGTKRLTPRDLEVLRLLIEGQTVEEIASALSVSEVVVWRHIWLSMETLAFPA